MEDAVATFRIFIDGENYLAIMGFPEDRTDEEIRVASISEMEVKITRVLFYAADMRSLCRCCPEKLFQNSKGQAAA